MMPPKSPNKIIAIMILIIAFLLTLLILSYVKKDDNIIDNSQRVEERFKLFADSMKKANELWELKFNFAEIEIRELNDVISRKESESKNEKSKQHEKVRIIRSSNTEQLYKFWAGISPDTLYH